MSFFGRGTDGVIVDAGGGGEEEVRHGGVGSADAVASRVLKWREDER